MSSVDEVKARAEALQAELQKKAQNFVPAEYKVSAQWESCAGNTLKQMSIGAFGGAVVASVLAPRESHGAVGVPSVNGLRRLQGMVCCLCLFVRGAPT